MDTPESLLECFERAGDDGTLVSCGAQYLDNDVLITLHALILDSVRTLARVSLEGGPFHFEVSRAFLQDEEGDYYTLIDVQKIPDGTRVLHFGPLRRLGSSVALFIDTLQRVDSDDEMPAIVPISAIDPWDFVAPAGLEDVQKSHRFSEEGAASATGTVGFWECRGNWQFLVSVEGRDFAGRSERRSMTWELPLAGQSLRLDFFQEGATCKIAALECIPAETGPEYHENLRQAFTRASTYAEFRTLLEDKGVPRHFVPTVLSNLALVSRDGSPPEWGTFSGPWGLLGSRNYFLFPPQLDVRAMDLLVRDILNVPLAEPWDLDLLIRELDGTERFNFNVGGPPIDLAAKFCVTSAWYAPHRIILSWEMEPFEGAERISVREASMIDEAGEEHFALTENIHWVEEIGDYLKGLSFPPLHGENKVVRFRIHRIDISLKEPLVIPVVPVQE